MYFYLSFFTPGLSPSQPWFMMPKKTKYFESDSGEDSDMDYEADQDGRYIIHVCGRKYKT